MQRRTFGLVLIIAGILFALVPLSLIEYATLTRDAALTSYLDGLDAEGAGVAQRLAEARSYNGELHQSGAGVIDPFDAELEEASSHFAKDDEVFAYLIIPRISLSLPIYLGASQHNLARGLAQVEGTSLPVGGEGTRTVIAGHNGWYNNNFLLYADQLVAGDVIYLVAPGQLLEYTVHDSEVILPSEGEKLASVAGMDQLTLLTCTPKPLNDKRLLVKARRVEAGKPEETTPPTPSTQADAGEVDYLRAELKAITDAPHPVASSVERWRAVNRVAVMTLFAGLAWAGYRLVRPADGIRRGK